MPTTDIHLKLDGISGESTAQHHPAEIDVLTWNWGVSNAASPAGGGSGGGGTGKAVFQNLTFTHRVDRASPELWKACATGKHIKDAVLSVAHGSASALDYIAITLSDVLVTSASLADSAADTLPPLESVTLSFAKLDYSYKPQQANGTLGTPVVFKFDLKTNKAG